MIVLITCFRVLCHIVVFVSKLGFLFSELVVGMLIIMGGRLCNCKCMSTSV